jgi:lipoprotein-anchoring transpeptidase ErfK/SrfK
MMMDEMGNRTLDHRACHPLEHRNEIRRLVLVVVLGLVLAACSSDDSADGSASVATEGPAEVTSPAAQVKEKPPLLPDGVDVLAVPSERIVPVWNAPASPKAMFSLDTQNPMGRNTPMLVDGAKRRGGAAWYEVLLPLRPNGSSGWVRGGDVTLTRIDQRIDIDLSERLLSYYVHDELKERFRVGVGTDATPTGTGSFYVWVKVHYASPYQPYGIAALGLSGFSPVLSEWPGGGRMAIHGTSSPTDLGNAVSHGCVRVLNGDLKSLLGVPLGTPVRITQ